MLSQAEGVHQWCLSAKRGDVHFRHAWRWLDTISVSLIILAMGVRLAASTVCPVWVESEASSTGHRALRASGSIAQNVSAVHGDALLPHAASAGNGLGHSGLGGASGGILASSGHELDGHPVSHCSMLVTAQMILALDAVPCFLRPLNWLSVYERIGVLFVILVELLSDIQAPTAPAPATICMCTCQLHRHSTRSNPSAQLNGRQSQLRLLPPSRSPAPSSSLQLFPPLATC